jgi:aerobic carbon-monoxide dehydrogenase medium subunit
MIPAAFDYLAPKSLDEALRLLAQHGADAKALAGGHSLIPMMKLRLTGHRYVVDLGRLPELKQLEQRDGRIEIGAMVTHAGIERSGLLRQACPLLAETAAEIGDVQVRNCGTIGGSLAHADPAADYPAAVLALDAEIVVGGPNGTRTIPASDFFIDLMTTALDPSELILAIRVAPQKSGTGSAYRKVPNPASGFAMVGVAAVVTMKGGAITDARIGVTGIAAKAFRARNAEQRLRGVKPDAAALRAASEAVTDGITVNGDMHGSSEYRAHLARVYARRAVEQAVARARG